MDFQNINVLSCSLFDEGTQKCHLGLDLFATLKLKLGQSILINYVDKRFVCKAWIRKDKKSNAIDFDRSVYSLVNENSAMKSCFRYLQVKDIIPQKTSFLKSVDVEVIVNACENVSTFEKDSTKHNLIQYLENKVFAAGDVMTIGGNHVVKRIKVCSTTPEKTLGFVSYTSSIVLKRAVSVERYEACNVPVPVLGGLNLEIKNLKPFIEAPLVQSEALKKLRTNCSKSVLLRGPPGCGKTSLVRLVASECNAVLVPVNGPDVVGSRPGETEEALRKLFAKARSLCQEGPTVMFFDELDNFCTGKELDRRVLNQLTHILDQAQEVDNLVIIGATNRPSALNPVLRRPGRFDREIFIGIPSQQQKEDILSVLFKTLPLSHEVNLKWLAEATPGFVGADLKSLVRQAVYSAIERAQREESTITVTNEDVVNALHVTIPSSLRGSDVLLQAKPVLWEDIGGLESVKTQVKQAIELPLTHPEAFTRLGLSRPKGVLLYGPPGCAKTTLVRAAATACNVTFLSVSGAQLYSPFVGDSEKKISEIFQQARAGAPCILFIDEIDSVVGSRSKDSAKQGSVQERVLSALLNEMDGVGIRADTLQRKDDRQMLEEGKLITAEKCKTPVAVDNNDVLVVGATNRPDMLDDALLRPGRIDKIIFVPTPDFEAREEILRVHTRKMTCKYKIDLAAIAEATENFSGADLENLCRETALHAISIDGFDIKEVEQHHFTNVLKTFSPTLTSDQLSKYSKLKFR